MADIFARTRLLLGEEKFDRLQKSRVLVVGCGGVGGFVCEFLVRTGIGGITIVDFDSIEPTNINRQVIATHKTLGQPKVIALQQRLTDICPSLKISAINERFCEQTKEQIFAESFDYVIDAIDKVDDKACLIETAIKKGRKIISATGAGNRFDIPEFEVKDIFKTADDGLAKALRKKLREKNVTALNCVCAKSKAQKIDGVVGSISYYPAACAVTLAAFVVNSLAEN